jgi:asparagine synthase (glutamine-hydrolysing)
MPGLAGFIADGRTGTGALEASLSGMSARIKHRHEHHVSGSFCDPGSRGFASAVVLRRRGLGGGHWRGPSGVQVWLDGEILGETGPLPLAEAAESLAENPSLPRNGAYAAVIHRPDVQGGGGRVLFVTDPFGLKYLYLRRTQGSISWCGDLKGFLAAPGEALAVNPACLQELFRYGYPLSKTTWFQGVELLEAGRLLAFDLKRGTWEEEATFDMESEMAPRPGNREATVAALGNLFRRAVRIRCAPGEKVGLTLSGGLDSRAILAALPSGLDPVESLTFGTPGCKDILLAERVARLRGARHTVVTLGEEGWLKERADSVWLTDGQINILDLHGVESLAALEARMDICQNGFLGDALLGGSYLEGKGFPFLERYRNRGRRFILQSLHHGGHLLHYRMPFLDLDLMKALAVPRDWIRSSSLYRSMLLKEFPEYFSDIPWEKTGLPISAPKWREDLDRFAKRVRRRTARALGIGPGMGPFYANYPAWLRTGSAAEFLRGRFERPDAPLFRHWPRAEVTDALRKHVQGADHSEWLGRCMTADLWLGRLESETDGRLK